MKYSLFVPPKMNKKLFTSDRILGILDKSIKFFNTTFIQGVTGLGKTSLLMMWITQHKIANTYHIFWVDCNEFSEDLMTTLKENIRKEQGLILVIWDQYEKVAFGPLDKCVVDINKHLPPDSRTCFITKGRIPEYIVEDIAMKRTNLITGLDLMFNKYEIRQYINVFKQCNLEMDSFILPEHLSAIPVTLNLIVIQYEKYGRSFPELIEYAQEQLFWHIKSTVSDNWTQEEFDLIKRVYPFKVINREIIRMLYGDCDKYSVLTDYANKNCFLMKKDKDNYSFTNSIVGFIDKLFSVLLDRDEYLSINTVAIRYYEDQKDYEMATALCIKIGYYKEAAISLLELHKTTNNHKFQTQYMQYYNSIPEDVIKNSIEVVFWKIINSLVQFDMPEFTKWYNVFMNKYTISELNDDEWAHLDMTYVYLRLISPTTTVDEFIQIIRKSDKTHTMDSFIKGLFKYEEMDMVTFLLLRRWNLEDGLEKFIDNPILEHFIGKQLYSLLMVYLGLRFCLAFRAEEALSCLEKGVSGCQEYGMYGPGLFGELYLLDAQRNRNVDRYDVLGKKEEIIKGVMSKADYVRRFDSFYIKIWLQRHNIEKINTWVSEQKKDLYDSHNLVNFRYFLQHIRVQILVEDLYNAQIKLDALIKSCEEFHFESDRVECYTLYSIICCRKNLNDKAMQYFLKAYWLAKKHDLKQIIVYEGVAIQPILFAVVRKMPNIGYEREFQEILIQVNARAKYYPKYLMPSAKQSDVLTKTEIEMLFELDSGDTLMQIAERRCVSLNTIKQHTKSIYSKLKVNNRSLAISIAKERGLI